MVVAAPHRFRPFQSVPIVALCALASACSHDPTPASAGATSTAKASARQALESGEALLAQGEGHAAEAEFERALTLDPGLAQAHFDLGQLRVQFSAEVKDSSEMAFARKNLEMLQRGIASIARAVELEPENDRYVSWLGRAYHQADDLTNARRCLEKAVELNPTDSTSHKRLGMVYAAIPETELAKAEFQKTIELDPKDANSYFQLGQLLEVQRNAAGARAAYEHAIANNPTQPEFYRKLMTVLARLGDQAGADAAERDMKRWQEYGAKLDRRQKAVSKSPRDAAAARRLGEVYLEGERWKMAAEWCAKAAVLDPEDVPAHLCSGVAHRHLKEFGEAERCLHEAAFRAPTALAPRLELVRLFAETRDEQALGEVVSEVEAVAVKDGPALLDLGLVCREVGRGPDAERLLGKARALGAVEPEPGAGIESGEPTGGR